MRPIYIAFQFCFVALWLASAPVVAAEPVLVFSVKTWEGDYTSADIPGGVKTTPSQSAIWTIDADGKGLKNLVPPERNADNPCISPDGRWLYFQAKAGGNTQIYRCHRDGSGITCLTSPEQIAKQFKGPGEFKVKDSFGYALSADGTKMVFTVHDGQSGRVVVSDADGSSPQFVAPHLGYVYMARLSPDNHRVVFSGPARGYRLLTVNLADGRLTELTPNHPDSFVPQFTPDGRTIIFSRRDGDIYRVDPDGKNLKRLTEGNRYVEFRLSSKDAHGSTDGPDISPDGKRIAFIAVKEGAPNVFAMDLDGANRQQLTARKTPCARPRWSLDGKQIAFVSFEAKYPQLFTVPAMGGEPRQLTRVDGAVYFVAWGR